jgi:hypothetical protein
VSDNRLLVFIQGDNLTGSYLDHNPALGILRSDRVFMQALTRIKAAVAVGADPKILADIQRYRR